MNKQWLEYSNKQKVKFEEEQMELQLLVGTNLVQLSQLEGIDSDKYNMVCQSVFEQKHMYLAQNVLYLACSSLHNGANC